jgi:broad specificity phosphatase PhoE
LACAAAWRLSEAGRARCRPLTDALAAYHPDVIAASVEPKARETAELVAAQLGCGTETGCGLEIVEGLHEHERATVSFLERGAFDAAVAAFFARPAELILGEETADQAHARFAAAVSGVIARYPGRTIAIVAHGTVISLFAARAAGLDPYPLWKSLELPSYLVLSLPDLHLLTVVESVKA